MENNTSSSERLRETLTVRKIPKDDLENRIGNLNEISRLIEQVKEIVTAKGYTKVDITDRLLRARENMAERGVIFDEPITENINTRELSDREKLEMSVKCIDIVKRMQNRLDNYENNRNSN